MKILGLDIGTKNIGVAVSDPMELIASGRENIFRKSDESALVAIKALVAEDNIELIVVGLPVNMDGSSGLRAKDAEEFAKKIEHATGINVFLWDERLSTREAENLLITADVSRKKRKLVKDKLAAQLILQGYLDSKNS
ncbi:MAG: Holliday junction resolvase RuvX [Candidatus Omnitrophica bacterium]|nr:Holliday junction resolvase RuvX [Candidatus Omnitrophota bacterium]